MRSGEIRYVGAVSVNLPGITDNLSHGLLPGPVRVAVDRCQELLECILGLLLHRAARIFAIEPHEHPSTLRFEHLLHVKLESLSTCKPYLATLG